MNLTHRILNSNFFIKLRSWEYWPFGIIQAPLFSYWLFLSLKERSLFFFSASNPGILMGGMFGESKFDVLNLVPQNIRPRTALVKMPTTSSDLIRAFHENNFTFPVIFKPDFGERGWMVRRINSETEAEEYRKEIKVDFLIQSLVDLPLEFGVFYVRYPREENGKVVSIVGKEMLYVTGDGKSTLQELIYDKGRAKLQWDNLRVKYRDRLDNVIASGERFELVSIGNHCLGTKFLNANHLINDRLTASFDEISKQIDGFYFGRFDLRVATPEDLQEGKVQVLELNGCGAEPAHIYDPSFSLWKAIRVLFRHWTDIYKISVQNHAMGVPYISFSEGRAIYRKFKSLTAKE